MVKIVGDDIIDTVHGRTCFDSCMMYYTYRILGDSYVNCECLNIKFLLINNPLPVLGINTTRYSNPFVMT